MSILVYFFGVMLLPALFTLLYVKKTNEPKRNLPPSPPKVPIIGNLHQLRGLLHRCVHDLSNKYGPVLFLQLGVVKMVVISSSEGAEEALKVHDLECCTRPKTHASWKFSRKGKDIGFAPYGEVWRELRKLSVLKFFSTNKVRSFRYIREEENDLMVKNLKEAALKKSHVDLSKTLFCLAGSIIFRAAFGQSFHESKHIGKDRIEELSFEVQKVASLSSSDLFPGGLGWFMDLVSGQHKRLHKVLVENDTFLNDLIDNHLKNPIGKTNLDRPDMVDLILDTMYKQQEDGSFKLTIDHLKGIMQNIYLAGIDTSAITMIWAMAELVKNPGVMKKAQDEIRACIGMKEEGRIKDEDVENLKYLKLVIKETLRLHPAGPLLLPRETISDIKIQGYDIPKQTLLLINAWSIGRDPTHWNNPEEFNPDRFLNCNVDYKGHNFELLPFGSGRRICPGMAFGIATVELGLVNLLYSFDWRLPEEDQDLDMEEAGDATIVKKVPLVLLPVLHN